MALSMVTGGQMALPVASAQEPVLTPAPIQLSEEAYNFFMAQIGGDLQAAAGIAYDLTISQQAVPSKVNSGDFALFNISITNNSNQMARYILFQDDIPAKMSEITYNFGGNPVTKYEDSGASTYLIDRVPAKTTISFAVRGKFTTNFRFDSATNTAKIVPLLAVSDPGQLKTSQASVSIENTTAAGGSIMYLPIIRRDPTPTPTPTPPIVLAYHENFDSSSAWVEFDSRGCSTDNRDSQYWVRIDEDSDNQECLPPARDRNKPESPYRTYGEFEVSAYHSEFENNASYGIFINGEGGDEYYLFRIWPNNGCGTGGDWQLIRYYDNDDDVLAFGNCEPAIKRGYGRNSTNVLKIRHTSDRRLTVFVNDKELRTITDTSRHLTGEGIGVYARRDNRETLIKFDDFKVYRFP